MNKVDLSVRVYCKDCVHCDDGHLGVNEATCRLYFEGNPHWYSPDNNRLVESSLCRINNCDNYCGEFTSRVVNKE